MERTLAKTSVVALLLFGGTASAQVVTAQAQVTVAVPTIHFEVAPPLVVVQPGVMVVHDYDEEIFFVGGWYWCHRGPIWYRTLSYRGGWVFAPTRYVPRKLVRLRPGHYRHFRAGPRHPMYRPGGAHHMGPRGGSRAFVGKRGGRAFVGKRGGGGMVVRKHGGRGFGGGGFGGGGRHGGGHRGRK